ncbi:ANTAR domain-containing protein [Streptomyces sp. NPDC028722]|uniref:ANTAR domain-containing protein n=1 Tax=Streptomyces sp. NPDC028722 TaxID=3155016 RepID=UPI0033EAE8B7
MDVRHDARPDPAATRPTPEPAGPAATITDLERERLQLREALTSRALIDQAIGVVIALGGLHPRQGFDVLRDASQHTNRKLRTVAGLVVDGVSGGPLPDDVRQALDAALSRAGARPG